MGQRGKEREMLNIMRSDLRRRINICTAALFGMLVISPAAATEFKVVAATGLQAPGAESGVLFSDFINIGTYPRFNAAGQVLLPGVLSGVGVHDGNDGGLWIVDTETSSIDLVARQGDQAPGQAEGVLFGPRAFIQGPHDNKYVAQPNVFNNAGQFLTWGDLIGPGVDSTSDSSMWTGSSSADLTMLARTGEQAVGFPTDVVYSDLLRSTPVINSSGKVVISGQVDGPAITPGMNGDALWSGTSAGLTLEVQQGTPAPGTTDKFSTHNYTGFAALIDDSGNLQIFSSLSENGIWTQSSEGSLWSGGNGAPLEMITRAFEPAPGLDAGVTLGYFVNLRNTTASGKFITRFQLTGPGVTVLNRNTIWTGNADGDLTLLARPQDASLPGSMDHLTFEVFRNQKINEAGTFVFTTRWDHVDTDSAYVTGIHRGTSVDDLELVLGGDQPVPGLDPGLRIRRISGLSLNNAGQFVFLADIGDTDLTNKTVLLEILFGYDPTTGLQQLVQTGDHIEVAAGDWRTIDHLYLTDGSILADGTRRGLSDAGQFLFGARFTDASEGYVVGSIVPEPSSLALVGIGVVLVGCRWRCFAQLL